MFISFSSGSCGNCYYLGDGNDGILIDAGISLRRLKKYLEERRLSFDSFSSIFITHDHLDHIRHLGSYCKKLCKPVYSTATIMGALSNHTFTREYIGGCKRFVKEGEWNELAAGLCVRPFVVPHDATQTVGYAIRLGELRFLIMTDAGRVTDEAIELASESSVVVIESNYDPGMLATGSYPIELQDRIRDGHGHLSNEECAEAIKKFAHEGLKSIFLCHRSENNNESKLAYDCSKEALAEIGAKDVVLRCLPREYPSPVFNL